MGENVGFKSENNDTVCVDSDETVRATEGTLVAAVVLLLDVAQQRAVLGDHSRCASRRPMEEVLSAGLLGLHQLGRSPFLHGHLVDHSHR